MGQRDAVSGMVGGWMSNVDDCYSPKRPSSITSIVGGMSEVHWESAGCGLD